MRALIEILHPAHVHFFRNFIGEMETRGHEIMVTARDKDVTLELLSAYKVPFVVLSTQGTGAAGLARELGTRLRRLGAIIKTFRPDVLAGIMGPTIAIAGQRHRVPSIVFYDTEFAKLTNRWVYRLATTVVTPECYQDPVPGDHVTYPGYHELAYLHPQRFTPDPERLRRAGVDPEMPIFLVRFVSWEASHDRAEVALTIDQKREIIDRLDASGQVIISSEQPLPPDLARYSWNGPTSDIHHLLAHARLVVGESATMSSEAAVLGTPAVFIAKTGRGYTDEQEARYGLVRHVQPNRIDDALIAISTVLETDPGIFAQARSRLLNERVDTTTWMVEWFATQTWAQRDA